MLIRLVAGLLKRRETRPRDNGPPITMSEIVAMINGGDSRSAIPLLEAILERQPDNIDALSNLACCLEETGNSLRAGELLAHACRLDDTHLAASLNYARHLSGVYRSADAMGRLRPVSYTHLTLPTKA